MGTEGILITISIIGLIILGIGVSIWGKNHIALKVSTLHHQVNLLKEALSVAKKQLEHLKENLNKVEAKFEVTNGSMAIIATNTEKHATATEKLCDATSENFHKVDKSICRVHDKLDNFKLNCEKYT